MQLFRISVGIWSREILGLMWEPTFQVRSCKLKPDLIAFHHDLTVDVNAQDVSDSLDLNLASVKYNGPDLIRAIKDLHDVSYVSVLTATLPWRGVLSSRDTKEQLDYGILNLSEMKVLATHATLAFPSFGFYLNWL